MSALVKAPQQQIPITSAYDAMLNEASQVYAKVIRPKRLPTVSGGPKVKVQNSNKIRSKKFKKKKTLNKARARAGR